MRFRTHHPSQELRTEMLDRIDLFRLADARLRYLSDRQAVIARNIANADTPNYAARDLTRFSFDSALTNRATADAARPVTLARTSSSHIDLPATGAAGPKSGKPARAYNEDISGNKVSLEEQMVKSADTMNAFSLASSAYAKSIAIMKLSIGSNR